MDKSIETEIIDFLKEAIEDYNPHEHKVTVLSQPGNQRLEVHYHTVYHNDYLQILEFLQTAKIAPLLAKISFSSEDEGINGTQYWDLKGLLEGDGKFENLEVFALPMNGSDNHNRIIVTLDDSYDENGGLGLLLDKCPQLQSLSVPSAPNEAFFARAAHGLKLLHVQSGYAHQDFIINLSQSTCFSTLASLTFRDYVETYMSDYKELCTPYAAYERLMEASALPALRQIVLYDTILDATQKTLLLELANLHGRSLEFRDL